MIKSSALPKISGTTSAIDVHLKLHLLSVIDERFKGDWQRVIAELLSEEGYSPTGEEQKSTCKTVSSWLTACMSSGRKDNIKMASFTFTLIVYNFSKVFKNLDYTLLFKAPFEELINKLNKDQIKTGLNTVANLVKINDEKHFIWSEIDSKLKHFNTGISSTSYANKSDSRDNVIHYPASYIQREYKTSRPQLIEPALMYEMPSMSKYWLELIEDEQYSYSSTCTELLSKCLGEEKFVRHLYSSDGKCIKEYISLTGAGSPSKDKIILSKLSRLIEQESHNLTGSYTITDISTKLMTYSHDAIKLFLGSEDYRQSTNWKTQCVYYDVTDLPEKLCRINTTPPRMFFFLGGTLGNFDINKVFESLNKAIKKDDLLFLTVYIHELFEPKHSDENVKRFTEKYNRPILKEWVNKTAAIFISEEGLFDCHEEILLQANNPPKVRVCSEVIKNSIIVGWPVNYRVNDEEHETLLTKSTRFSDDEFPSFVESKGYKMLEKSPLLDNMRSFLFRKI